MEELRRKYGPGAPEKFNTLLRHVCDGGYWEKVEDGDNVWVKVSPDELDPTSRQVYDLYRTRINDITDGTAQSPTGPGLGIEVDEVKVVELTKSTERSEPLESRL